MNIKDRLEMLAKYFFLKISVCFIAMVFNPIKNSHVGIMKFTHPIILLFTSLQTFAQVAIKNMSLIKPDTNILIQHMDNKIQVLGINQKAYLTSKNGASISTYDNNTFVIKPKTLMPDTFLVYAGEKLLLKKVFFIDTLPEIKIQLGAIQGDTATVSEILANKAVMAVLKGSLYYFPIRILSFTTTFMYPAGEMQTHFISTQGNTLSPEQIAIIKNLHKNSKILFDDILAVAADARTRRLKPFYITIH
jgi:hypothetical protein